MNPLYEQMETSVFERMSLAAAKHGAGFATDRIEDLVSRPDVQVICVTTPSV